MLTGWKQEQVSAICATRIRQTDCFEPTSCRSRKAPVARHGCTRGISRTIRPHANPGRVTEKQPLIRNQTGFVRRFPCSSPIQPAGDLAPAPKISFDTTHECELIHSSKSKKNADYFPCTREHQTGSNGRGRTSALLP